MNTHAKTRKMSLRKAIAAKLIDIKASALGGISCKALRISAKNNTDDPLELQIEPGLMFKPDDPNTQPLVTLGDEVLALSSCEQKSVDLVAFCGNSGASCPRQNGRYTFERQLDTSLSSILRYTHGNNLPLWLSQSIVWMYTNNHSLNSVYDSEHPKESEDLIKYIAAKRKMKVPTFYMGYGIDLSGNSPVIRRGQERIYANMSWDDAKASRNVHVSVYKPDGTLYKRINSDIITDKNGSTVVVEFLAFRDPPGKYIIRVHDDANSTLQEKTIALGVPPDSY